MRKTPIRNALLATSSLREHVKNGLAALGKGDHKALDTGIRRSFDDSLALDSALASDYAHSNRWDYLLGHAPSREVVGLEPHSAETSEISRVIKKRKHAIMQLKKHLRSGASVAEWYWVASGGIDFVPYEKKVLHLQQEGIRFVGKVLLAKHLPRAAGSSSRNGRPRGGGRHGRQPH